MNQEKNNNQENDQLGNIIKTAVNSSIFVNNGTSMKFITPLEMRWKPKEDISTYELAKCLPYLIRYNAVMPYEVDRTEIHFRHFDIIDHNS
jgi:hypothetical protein